MEHRAGLQHEVREGKDRDPVDDRDILSRIDELIKTEHELRTQLADGTLSGDEEHARLRSAEEALDQCWDLLRQRRARREFGEDPGQAESRPVPEVEGYWQ
jgi:Protein of unknown function (DUF2630)